MDNVGDWIYIVFLIVAAISGLFSSKNKKKRPTQVLGQPGHDSYPEENTSRAYTHETVVRPLGNGGFAYVSNRIIFPEGGYEPWWHSDRLTEDQ